MTLFAACLGSVLVLDSSILPASALPLHTPFFTTPVTLRQWENHARASYISYLLRTSRREEETEASQAAVRQEGVVEPQVEPEGKEG